MAADPFPDYDVDPVIDQEYARTGKRPVRQAAALPEPPAAAAPEPQAAVMARPASKEEAKARLAAMMGRPGSALEFAAAAVSVATGSPTPAATALVEASLDQLPAGATVLWGDPVAVPVRQVAVAPGGDRLLAAAGRQAKPSEAPIIPKPQKNRPAAPEPSTVDRDRKRGIEAEYRDRNRAAYNARKREAMQQRRHSAKAARILAQRERDSAK